MTKLNRINFSFISKNFSILQINLQLCRIFMIKKADNKYYNIQNFKEMGFKGKNYTK